MSNEVMTQTASELASRNHAGGNQADNARSVLDYADAFAGRHLGPTDADLESMLGSLGFASLEELTNATIPKDIQLDRDLDIPNPRGEHEFLNGLAAIASKNKVYRSCIGMGYTGTVTPPVILRNVLENPGWYTQYTPYQAEIAQGRLEALLNFQTMIADLTALPLAGASLLDEATAAAEAMTMCSAVSGHRKKGFFASDACHPQTLALMQTRADGLGIDLCVGPTSEIDFSYGEGGLCGMLLQYPTTDGSINDYSALAEEAKQHKCMTVVAADLLSLTLLKPPG